MPTFDQAAYAWICRIPRGRVATYGQVATHLGSPRSARAVGYALARTLGSQIPWQRVINARGEISIGGALERPELQVQLLIAEGVEIDAAGRIDLKRFRWTAGPYWQVDGQR